MQTHSNQTEQKRIRWPALSHAVESLTVNRDTSPVVTLDHLQRTMKYVCDTLQKASASGDIRFPHPHEQVNEPFEAFAELQAARVGRRKAGELQVLFLRGSQPMGDLEVMFELGIRRENVWMAEAPKLDTADGSQFTNGYSVKSYHGSLPRFFELVPQQFDIVFFDSGESLPSSQTSTLDTLRQLLERQRLTPLSVLITNFAQANEDGRSLDLWAKRLGAWFCGRREWNETKNIRGDYCQYIAEHLDYYYSSFITRFVIELAGLLMPWWRAAALEGARREYYSAAYSDGIDLKSFHTARKLLESYPETMFYKDGFPAYREVLYMVEEHLPKNDPLRKLFCVDAWNRVTLTDAIWLAFALRNYGDPGFGVGESLHQKICSEAAFRSLKAFRWFDQDSPLFSDEPQPHLLADLLLGFYGFPYHCNLAKLRRWRYEEKAKNTPMYLDVFVFDQARYFYEAVPPLPWRVDELHLPQQWILRVCMDVIYRHTRAVCGDLFYASALAPEGVPGFPFHTVPDRETISPKGSIER